MFMFFMKGCLFTEVGKLIEIDNVFISLSMNSLLFAFANKSGVISPLHVYQ